MKALYFLIGGKRDGSGHILRAIEIKKAFSEYDIEFFITGENAISLCNTFDLSVKPYPDDIVNYVKAKKPVFIILDNHGFEEKLVFKLKKITKIISFDDTSSGMPFCNLVIDAQKMPDNNPNHLFGLKYVIIRENIRKAQKKPHLNKEILIFGGASSHIYCFIKGIVKSVKNILSDEFIRILLPDTSVNITNDDKIITTLIGKSGFEKLLLKSKLFITSGGVSMYEASYLGIPFIVFPLVAHQRQNISNFLKQGGKAFYWEDATDLKMLEALLMQFKKSSDEEIAQIIKNNQSVIDGKGIFRIKEKIKSLIKK